MLMTFLGMKLKVTQNRKEKGEFVVCYTILLTLCITGRRLVTNSHYMGKCAHRNYELAYTSNFSRHPTV